MATPKDDSWKSILHEARTRLAASIPQAYRLPASALPSTTNSASVVDFPNACGLLSEREVAITESTATAIVGRVASGEWGAEEVVRGFVARACVAQQLLNCLTVTMFDAALTRARELDAHFARTGKTVGLLHGLPVSLKDNFNIPGLPSAVGFAQWALDPMEQESTIVGIMRDLGAVAFVKTNVPTAMMIAETVNNVYGRTLNPLNPRLTPGGSSGGESALLAIHGTPLGIGTDIGGSLRIPAACTATYTLKPSLGRFPHADARSALAGQESVPAVHGPMAHTAADLRLFASVVVGTEPWRRDAKCLPIPWRTVDDFSPAKGGRKPKLGVLRHNGMVTPTPPVARALAETTAKLAAAGYELVDWPATDHAEALELLGAFFLSDGGKSIQNLLTPTSEPWRPEMKAYEDAAGVDAYALWQLHKRRSALQKRYLDRWRAAGIDAVLGPTTPFVAPVHRGWRHVGYTGVVNVLDYAAVSFPCGVVADKGVDVYGEGEGTEGTGEGEDGEVREGYRAEEVDGLGVSLQIFTGRLEEEKCLAVLERVEEDLMA